MRTHCVALVGLNSQRSVCCFLPSAGIKSMHLLHMVWIIKFILTKNMKKKFFLFVDVFEKTTANMDF